MGERSRTTMTIGPRVRRERTKRGWSVRELARRAQVSPGAVSKLESGGRVAPSLELGKRLAKALGVTLDYLAGMYDEEEADPAGSPALRGIGAALEARGPGLPASASRGITPLVLGSAKVEAHTCAARPAACRAIQFSASIPMRARANAGWAAKRRHAAAIFV
jgi:transcriptional regulator with XRE-family HTH domain